MKKRKSDENDKGSSMIEEVSEKELERFTKLHSGYMSEIIKNDKEGKENIIHMPITEEEIEKELIEKKKAHIHR